MKSRKFLVFIILITTVSIAYFIFFFNRPKQVGLNISEKTTSSSITPTTPNQNLRQLINLPRLHSDETIQSKSEADDNCINFYTELQRLNLDDLSYPPKLTQLPKSPESCKKIPQVLTQIQADYQKNCLSFFDNFSAPKNKSEWDQEIGLCQVFLYFLRAGIATWQTQDLKLSEITDLRILTDRLAYAFTKMFGAKPDTSELVSVGERMLEVDPKIYGAAKAVTIGNIVHGLFNANNEKYWESVEKTLSRTQEIAINRDISDEDLAEMQKVVNTRGYDPKLIKQQAEQDLINNPNSSETYNHLGYANWRLGNRKEAKEALQKAMTLDPKNDDYKTIWKNIHMPNATSEAYIISIKLGVTFDRLLN